MMEILQPGLLTTVQDGGRRGFQQYGVPVCGAMDWLALAQANVLVGNPEDEAALELTGLGPTLRFHQENCFALTGGTLSATLDECPVEMGRAYYAPAGAVLRLGAVTQGFRAYLAVAGGLELPMILGSRSTCLAAGFGGYHGRSLQKGDWLGFRAPQRWLPGLPVRRLEQTLPEDDSPLGVILGPQADAFTPLALQRFFSEEYRVTAQCDRMGARLTGPILPLKEGQTPNILSDGVAMGSIQVPNGQPILMLADRQTTGGYVKLGTVIAAHLPRAAQKKPGDPVRFRQVSVEEAQALLRDCRRRLRNAALALDTPEEW